MISPETLVGKQINHFQLSEFIAKGAMGMVFKAFDTKLSRTVALKLIAKEMGHNAGLAETAIREEARKRLMQEAIAAGRLCHPAIVAIHSFGETEEFEYICMEYVPGRTLADILKEQGTLAVDEALSLFEQVLTALDAAHREGIVHRDIKPSNIMISDQGGLKLTDFGVAKLPSFSMTVTGTVLGTPYYMSPEQISGQKVDIRSDIFSTGVVLYQALTGERPFEGTSTAALAYKIVQMEPVSPKRLNPGIPEPLDAVIRKALAKDPAMRYQTPLEMLGELKAAVHGPGVEALEVDSTLVSTGMPVAVGRMDEADRETVLRDAGISPREPEKGTEPAVGTGSHTTAKASVPRSEDLPPLTPFGIEPHAGKKGKSGRSASLEQSTTLVGASKSRSRYWAFALTGLMLILVGIFSLRPTARQDGVAPLGPVTSQELAPPAPLPRTEPAPIAQDAGRPPAIPTDAFSPLTAPPATGDAPPVTASSDTGDTSAANAPSAGQEVSSARSREVPPIDSGIASSEAELPITERIKRALDEEGYEGLSVSEEGQGVISLSGVLRDMGEMRNLESIALGFAGVRRVDTSKIVVTSLRGRERIKRALSRAGFPKLTVEELHNGSYRVSGSENYPGFEKMIKEVIAKDPDRKKILFVYHEETEPGKNGIPSSKSGTVSNRSKPPVEGTLRPAPPGGKP